MSETAATLRRALEKIRTLTGHGCYDCMMAEPNRCPRCAEIDETVDTALASPDCGASAVLAAFLEWLEGNLTDDQLSSIGYAWRARRSRGTDG